MTTPVILKYPLDLTGTQESNLVQGEITRVPRTTGRHFAPMEGPFFENSLVIHTVPDNRLLIKDVDYRCVYLYEYASVKAGQAVVAVVSIINPDIYGDLRYDYQVIGGEFSTNVTAIQLLIENLALDDRVVSWDNILDRPVTFPPSPHLHDVGDWYGMEAVVQAIDNLTAAILVGSQDLYDQLNARFDALYALYIAQQAIVANTVTRVNAIESTQSTFAQQLQQLQNTLTQIAQGNLDYVRYIPDQVDTAFNVDKRYLIQSNRDVLLPNTNGLEVGQNIEFEIVNGLQPIFKVMDSTTQKVRRRGKLDTSFKHDGQRPKLTVIYVGNHIWEIRI